MNHQASMYGEQQQAMDKIMRYSYEQLIKAQGIYGTDIVYDVIENGTSNDVMSLLNGDLKRWKGATLAKW